MFLEGGGECSPLPYFLKGGLFMTMEVSAIVGLYVECIQIALPFTVVFALCDIVVSMVLRTAFGGRLTFRG